MARQHPHEGPDWSQNPDCRYWRTGLRLLGRLRGGTANLVTRAQQRRLVWQAQARSSSSLLLSRHTLRTPSSAPPSIPELCAVVRGVGDTRAVRPRHRLSRLKGSRLMKGVLQSSLNRTRSLRRHMLAFRTGVQEAAEGDKQRPADQQQRKVGGPVRLTGVAEVGTSTNTVAAI